MKPMLAGKCSDIRDLHYPVLASVKLDGVRALVIHGVVMSRQLKPIPSQQVQKWFSGLPHGTDGELIVGPPTAADAYRLTESTVMSEDKHNALLRFHVFDNFAAPGGFSERMAYFLNESYSDDCVLVEQRVVNSLEELKAFEEWAVEQGFEGLMVRSLHGPYKHGRSTEKEGHLLKVKRFCDSEAEIIGAYERMHNGNKAIKNALGRTERSSHKANLRGRGDLGGFDVRDIHTGVEFSIGTGFDDADRKQFWKTRESLIGKIVKYQYFPTGSKDKPRFPVYLGFRNKIDIGENN